MAKTKLDKDLKKLSRLEGETRRVALNLLPASLALLFLVLAGLVAFAVTGMATGWMLIVGAAVIGGYMALNIGANDVANNMAPAVGSRALKISVAVALAAVFEAAGAIIAGGEVVATVSGGIIDPELLPSTEHFITGMVAALFAAAVWLNVATAIGAPVSTTHSIVGGVLGGGIAMAGFGVADWGVVARIVASWVVSPLLGGLIAASFLAYIEFKILFVEDKLEQARQRVPMLVAIMAGVFAAYLLIKSLDRIWEVPLWLALLFGLAAGVITRAIVKPLVVRRVESLSGRRESVGELFTIPVIFAACLLSFAHGSNDVANAIGPLAAIYTSVTEGQMVARAEIPIWILLVGAIGISTGLLLYGPKLIRTVGSKITKLNRVRAFCVSLSAAITVIIASTFGIPVSSTHIAIGALFGVGFLREYLVNRDAMSTLPLQPPQPEIDPETGEPMADNKYLKAKRRYLVRRSHVVTIVTAWIVTVPATALMAAGLALALNAVGIAEFAGSR
jgi:inorganic phosphate transporter, PiT family